MSLCLLVTSSAGSKGSRLPHFWFRPWALKDTMPVVRSWEEALHFDKILVADITEAIRITKGVNTTSHGVVHCNLGDGVTASKKDYTKFVGLSNYASNGSYIVTCPSPEAMYKGSRPMQVIWDRCLQKMTKPQNFLKKIPEDFTIIRDGQQELMARKVMKLADTATFMTIDFETMQYCEDEASGRCYGGIITLGTLSLAIPDEDGNYIIKSFSCDFRCPEDHAFMQTVFAHPIPKVYHNAKYDTVYHLRWNCPAANVVGDTMVMQKAQNPDLRYNQGGFYTLQAVSNFNLEVSIYWKDGLNSDGDKFRHYGMRDTHNTALVWINQVRCLNQHTFKNFIQFFKRLPATMACSMHGFRVLPEEKGRLSSELAKDFTRYNNYVQKVTGYSANQSAKLAPFIQAISQIAVKSGHPAAKKLEKTDKNSIRDIQLMDAIGGHVFRQVELARQSRTMLANFVTAPAWSADKFNGGFGDKGEYIVSSFNFDGTISARLSSSASALWMGINLQNVPAKARQVYGAPKGAILAASDLSAAETWTTAFCSRCIELRETLRGEGDFHKNNASLFFGIPYDDITSEIRNIGKRVNHAANYNMGVATLIEQAGYELLMDAKELLKLPAHYTVWDIAKHMLDTFDKAYPTIRTRWATEQAYKISKTGRLFCVTGYSPVMNGQPFADKPSLNRAMATEPQHTGCAVSLDTLDNIYDEMMMGLKIFPIAQVHDEIIFAVPDNEEDKKKASEAYMKCADIKYDFGTQWEDGEDISLTIPTDKPIFGYRWYDIKG